MKFTPVAFAVGLLCRGIRRQYAAAFSGTTYLRARGPMRRVVMPNLGASCNVPIVITYGTSISVPR
jgi:hypothetical protein